MARRLFEIARVLVCPYHACQSNRKRESAEALQMHPERRRNTNKMASSMKARPQLGRQQSATLVEQAQRVMRESRELLEQREAQLKQMERFVVRAGEKLRAFVELESTIRSRN